MLKIGITGGMGSGKTTVCKIFEQLDIPVYYADKEAKNILWRDKNVRKKVKTLLGDGAYFRNGRPDRSYIAQKIFNNKTWLEGMNSIIHPAVREDAALWHQKYENSSQPPPFTLQEAALLVESGSYRLFDKLIVVTCPEEIRIKRIMKRDRTPEAEVRKKLSHQWPESSKVAVADYVIINDGLHLLLPQVLDIYHKIKQAVT